MNESAIPQELKALDRWVLWRNDKIGSGTTKIPYQTKYHRKRAKSNDARTWSTYEQAVAASNEDEIAGIGIMLGGLEDGRNLCGIDLDNCIDGGVMNPDAEAIVQANPTYWEVSPSGTGLKCIGYGHKPKGAGAKTSDVSFKCVEVYDVGRWFAVTGNVYAGGDVLDIQESLAALCSQVGLTPTAPRKAAKPLVVRPVKADDATARASAYLAMMDPAIQGCSGHAALFKAACAMAHGFDLGSGAAVQLLASEYNPRCVPAWDLNNPQEAAEFARKVDQALKANHEHPRGHLLHDAGYAPAPAEHRVDFSALTRPKTAPKPHQNRPAPQSGSVAIPKHLLQPPGLLGKVSGWINATAPMYQPELSLANSIAFVGALLGKKVRTEEDGRTNFYCLGLGDSCTGKNHSREQVGNLAEVAGVGNLLAGEDVSSDAALMRIAAANPALLLQFDEIGHFIAAKGSNNASTYERAIVPTLTKMFTSANTVMRGKEYADGEARVRVDVVEPNVCLYGTATPDQVFRSLSLEQITDGFMGRLLIFASSDNDPDWRKIKDKNPPKSLIDLVGAWGMFEPQAPAGSGNLVAAKPKPMTVYATPKAGAILDKFRSTARVERRKLLTAGGLHPLWGRAYEQASKLALVASLDRPDGKFEVGHDAASWATELVGVLIHGLVDVATNRVSSSTYESMVIEITEAIRSGGLDGISRRGVSRTCRKIKARDRDEIVKDLAEDGVITVSERQQEPLGRPSKWYTINH